MNYLIQSPGQEGVFLLTDEEAEHKRKESGDRADTRCGETPLRQRLILVHLSQEGESPGSESITQFPKDIYRDPGSSLLLIPYVVGGQGSPASWIPWPGHSYFILITITLLPILATDRDFSLATRSSLNSYKYLSFPYARWK